MTTDSVQPQSPRDTIPRAYLDAVLEWHGYLRTLGLPTMKDNPSVPIHRLYVAPALSATPISPDAKEQAGGESILDLLDKHRRLVVQGDPGSGKSTLVNWLAWRLAAGLSAPLPDYLRDVVPIPLILRELNPEGMDSFDMVLSSFLKRPVAQAFKQDPTALLAALRNGKALVLIDGLDELPDTPRNQLIGALRKAFVRYKKSIWLITSRVIGFDEAFLKLDRGDALGPDEIAKQFSILGSASSHLQNTLHDDQVRRPIQHETTVAKLYEHFRSATEGQSEVLSLSSSEALERYASVLDHLSSSNKNRPWRNIQRVYVAPFDDQRIDSFSRAWYQIRGSLAQETATCDNFLRAVRANAATHALARNPQILTLMALVFRTRLDLPQGRALLYEYITQAYLESIDQAYGILDDRFTWQEKKRLLSKVGFEMQFRRASHMEQARTAPDSDQPNSENSPQGILFSESDVKDWIVEAMAATRSDACHDLAAAFLDHISRRSGLLLPRGEGLYAFVHLTFQEYFAALYLRDEICSPEFVEEKSAVDGRIDTNALYDWSGMPPWHETLLFLHELVGTTPRWAARIEQWVFGNYSSAGKDAPDSDWHRLKLRALVADDIHAGLSKTTCEEIFSQASKSLAEFEGSLFFPSGATKEVFDTLCKSSDGSDTLLRALEIKPSPIIRLSECGENFSKIATAPCVANNAIFLVAENTGIPNLDWLKSGYKKLAGLVVHDQGITNIEAVVNCTDLMSILVHCPQLEDISPLLRCKNLSDILLSAAKVTDLSQFVDATHINITGDLSQIPAGQAAIFRTREKEVAAKRSKERKKKNESAKKYYLRDRGAEARKPPVKLK